MLKFEIVARAVVVNDDKILLCYNPQTSNYFLPGGHVEVGEPAGETLKRELKEEFDLTARDPQFIGAVENMYEERDAKHHELNLIFTVAFDDPTVRLQEDHISFTWCELAEFPQKKILPPALHNTMLKWLKDRKVFWASDIEV